MPGQPEILLGSEDIKILPELLKAAEAAKCNENVLALMHGTSYRGDGRRAILDLAGVIHEKLAGQE